MKVKLVFLTVSFLVAAALGGELYFALQEQSAQADVLRLNGISGDGGWQVGGGLGEPPGERRCWRGFRAEPSAWFEFDGQLGYRLKPNLRALPEDLRVGGRSVYSVTASTGRFGWRATPQDMSARGDVLFFGDGYVFGDGLNDGDTLPARFSAAMNGAAFAHNFGVPGWGPQQALRLLEIGGEKPELGLGRPTKAFFIVDREQFLAAAGGTPETAGSPRYVIGDRGVEQEGRFPEEGAFHLACRFSALCGEALRHEPRRAPASPDLVAAMLARMAGLLRDRYGIGLTTVLWSGSASARFGELGKALAARGLDVVWVSAALPGPESDWIRVEDDRPNGRAAAALGKYLADRLRR